MGVRTHTHTHTNYANTDFSILSYVVELTGLIQESLQEKEKKKKKPP